MNKLIRFYNQNRNKFWLVIITIILVFVIIRLVNNWIRDNKNNNIDTPNNIAYYSEGESIVSDNDVPEYNREEFGTLISSFLDYCILGNTNEAYNLLSNECKDELYPYVQDFENLYRSKNFDTSKTYTFQSWTSQNSYIYQIRIFENSLYTGNTTTDDYIQDYYNIVYEDGQAKLNISGFVKTDEINKNVTINNVDIKVNEIHYYMDYATADISIQNSSDKNILLDTMEDVDTVFLQTSSGTKLTSFLSYFSQEDMILNANNSKDINVRFNFSYSDSVKIQSLCFTDVVMNYDVYMQGGLLQSDRQQFIIEI